MAERDPNVLHHALVEPDPPGGGARRWAFWLHGILGSGANWRTIARRLAADLPDWGHVLVDLRAHGLSPVLAPPHGVAAAAADVVALERTLGVEASAILGHSFGGKVAILAAEARPTALEALVLLDSNPGQRRSDAVGASRVVEALSEIGPTFPSREAFLQAVEARGFSRPLGEWLAMNVRRDGDLFRFRVPLDVVTALLADYFALDRWPAVEEPDPSRVRRVVAVVGERSDAFDAEDRARLEAAAARGSVELHVLERAGHWLHVDDPEGLLAVVRGILSAAR